MRLIDADAFDERIRAAGGMAEEELSDDFKDGVLTTLEMLKRQPTIEPERKPGRWIKISMRDLLFKCSECGTLKLVDSHYCPNCGAKMEAEHETDRR